VAEFDSTSTYFQVLDIVKTECQLRDSYIKEGIPTYILAPDAEITEKCARLRSRLSSAGLNLILQQGQDELVLQVFPSTLLTPPVARGQGFLSAHYPKILFAATILTVSISGYLTAINHLALLKILGRFSGNEALQLLELTVLYVIAIMSAIGLHEVGHTIAARRHGVAADLPLFIPGIPGFGPGTFGAVIRQRGPTRNRDQLFDIGFSGPLVGFVVSLVVSYFGYSFSVPVSRAEMDLITQAMGPGSYVFLPTIFTFLAPYILPSPGSFTHILHPLAIAGWIGTLITFLNAFPFGQFDGGHVARAVLGPKWHRRIAYVALGGMFLAGWWFMAALALFLFRNRHPGTLDDVTPLSTSRKILALLFIAIFVSCFTLSPDSPLLILFS
jgi:membrane-associated protease RseP (regulator of RpoE activity)